LFVSYQAGGVKFANISGSVADPPEQHLMPLDLTDDEKAALIDLLRGTIPEVEP
jgi:hypothetical protein